MEVILSQIKTAWNRGERSTLAKRVGISDAHLCQILDRNHKSTPHPKLATSLSNACKEMGIPITREEWLYKEEHQNPLFKN